MLGWMIISPIRSCFQLHSTVLDASHFDHHSRHNGAVVRNDNCLNRMLIRSRRSLRVSWTRCIYALTYSAWSFTVPWVMYIYRSNARMGVDRRAIVCLYSDTKDCMHIYGRLSPQKLHPTHALRVKHLPNSTYNPQTILYFFLPPR